MDDHEQTTPATGEAPEAYEAPRAEDVDTEAYPSVTAAGGTKTIGAG